MNLINYVLNKTKLFHGQETKEINDDIRNSIYYHICNIL